MTEDYVLTTEDDADSIGVISVLDTSERSGVMDFRHRARYFGLKRKLSTLSDVDLLVYELAKAMDTTRSNIVITNITYFN